MKKVVTINLNGRAYQVEEAGYEKLQDYLARTEKTLNKNPDKAEIVADIEQAIAEKCDSVLTGGKNVVSSEQVVAVLEKVGPVHEAEHDSVVEPEAASNSTETPRKLYRLPKEQQIGGVCAGLAAYFGTDVTVMRLLFVLLLFLTQGFMILIYIVLAIVMPEAKKPEEVALAYGKPDTAKQIVERVKEVATDKDVIMRIGAVIDIVGRVFAKIITIISAVIFGSLTLLWLWLIGAIGLGETRLYDELASVDGIKQAVFITALYIVIALPFFAVVRVLDRVGRAGKSQDRNSKTDGAVYASIVSLIVIATVAISAFFSVYADTVRTYIENHSGYVQMGSRKYCIDESRCLKVDVPRDDIEDSTR